MPSLCLVMPSGSLFTQHQSYIFTKMQVRSRGHGELGDGCAFQHIKFNGEPTMLMRLWFDFMLKSWLLIFIRGMEVTRPMSKLRSLSAISHLNFSFLCRMVVSVLKSKWQFLLHDIFVSTIIVTTIIMAWSAVLLGPDVIVRHYYITYFWKGCHLHNLWVTHLQGASQNIWLASTAAGCVWWTATCSLEDEMVRNTSSCVYSVDRVVPSLVTFV